MKTCSGQRNKLTRPAMYSTDDMGWLCNWGGNPLIEWERIGLLNDDPAVIDFVDYWLWKETIHASISNTRWQGMYGQDSFLLHMYVHERRAQSDRARELGLSYQLPP